MKNAMNQITKCNQPVLPTETESKILEENLEGASNNEVSSVDSAERDAEFDDQLRRFGVHIPANVWRS